MEVSECQAVLEGAVVAFPLERRADRVRHLAARLRRKRSQEAADRECSRVADEMFAWLASLGMSDYEQDEAVGAFFLEVDREFDRLEEAEPAVLAGGQEG